MKMKIPLFPRAVTVSLWTGLLSCLLIGNQQAQIFSLGGSTSFQGQATAVSGFALGSSLTFVNTGTLLVSGGAQEASSLGASSAGVFSAGDLHTATIGQANVVTTEASVADVWVNSSSFFFAGGSITADFVMSRATATCAAIGATVIGVVEVDGLVIDGQSIVVTGQANQVAFVDGNVVIINEQVVGAGFITVNALHVMTSAGASLIFASSTAGITCGSVPSSPSTCDFVTGGGWIVGASGAKANFGVAGGIKDGAFWGHLNYIDHHDGMHVKQTAVTGYAEDPNDPNCRYICYDVTVNDAPAYYAVVHVCDNGEPGRNDIFEIKLYTTPPPTPPPPACWQRTDTPFYSAGGDLGGNHPGGGNIQLHHDCD